MPTDATDSVSRPLVVISTKSVGIQILLIFFLGPLGLFYSTIVGALIMLLGVPAVFAVAVFVTGLSVATANSEGGVTVGLAALGGEIFLMAACWWIGSFIWGVIAVNRYNEKLLARASG